MSLTGVHSLIPVCWFQEDLVNFVCGSSCLQVFLGPNGEVEEYSVTSIQRNAAISSDLILDQNEEHLFIMTPNMVCARLS